MKELNANRNGKSLILMGGDFKFYCQQVKNPVGTLENFRVFPSEDESPV